MGPLKACGDTQALYVSGCLTASSRLDSVVNRRRCFGYLCPIEDVKDVQNIEGSSP